MFSVSTEYSDCLIKYVVYKYIQTFKIETFTGPTRKTNKYTCQGYTTDSKNVEKYTNYKISSKTMYIYYRSIKIYE